MQFLEIYILKVLIYFKLFYLIFLLFLSYSFSKFINMFPAAKYEDVINK